MEGNLGGVNDLSVYDNPNAQLPSVYETAKAALAECVRIDECKDWADKSAAMESYARQLKDDTLLNEAKRIKGRAHRRMGELLKEFDARPDNSAKQSVGDHTLLSQKDVAEIAGLSPHQTIQAVRVANVPLGDFESQIESSDPPSISQIAQQGIRRRQNTTSSTEPQSLSDLKVGGRKRYRAVLEIVAKFSDAARLLEELIETDLTPAPKAERQRALEKLDSINRDAAILTARLKS